MEVWVLSSNFNKLVALVIVAAFTVTFLVPLLPRASATPVMFSMDPISGQVGTIVNVTGAIDTFGGDYEIWWDYDYLLKGGSCESDSVAVSDTFTVPSDNDGYHYVTLFDPYTYEESDPVLFDLFVMSYTLSVQPSQIQEGQNATITVGIQGAEANKSYSFTTIVTTPANASYSTNLTLTTDEIGLGAISETFWGGFPASNTNLVGTYSITVNDSLTTGSFKVGLTDKLMYDTNEIVHIRGSGYAPNENVTVNIRSDEASIAGYPKNIIADMEGVVIDTWKIPKDTETGTHIVTLVNATAPGTIKEPADTQEFDVTHLCYIQTQNLDNEPLGDVIVEIFNATNGNLLISQKTNETGWTIASLEQGNYSMNAYWEYVFIGSLSDVTLKESTTIVLECQIARIGITVKDEAQTPIPFINITLLYDYTNRYGENLKGTYSNQTNLEGTVYAYNMLTNINYTLEARRYGYLFDTTILENFAPPFWIDITCPTYALLIDVLDSEGLPIQNVQVKVYEWSSGLNGLVGEGNTNEHGSIEFTCTFSKYVVRVYDYYSEQGKTVLLNETVTNLVEDPQVIIVRCKIFNLESSIQVVDYFGQPIPNAVVKVERKFEQEYVELASLTTGFDGKAVLPKIGGYYRISINVLGKTCEVRSLNIDQSKSVLFKLDKHLVIGPYLLETTQLITIISTSVTVVFFLLVAERTSLFRKLNIKSSKELRKIVKRQK